MTAAVLILLLSIGILIMSAKSTLLQEAEAQVRKEAAEKAKSAMVDLVRQRAAAQKALAAIELRIADLEQQIVDGTL